MAPAAVRVPDSPAEETTDLAAVAAVSIALVGRSAVARDPADAADLVRGAGAAVVRGYREVAAADLVSHFGLVRLLRFLLRIRTMRPTRN